MAQRLFNASIMLDWSARAAPARGRDTIWIAHDLDGPIKTLNPATRHEAIAALSGLLLGALEKRLRVLVGCDFPFAYPRGAARAIAGKAEAMALWKKFAQLVEDAPDNANNRLELAARLNRDLFGLPGPYWGLPNGRKIKGLDVLKAAVHRYGVSLPPEHRMAERRARTAKSVWQLCYTGSVGSQALLGMARLQALRTDPQFRDHIQVWPFETGLAPPSAPIVLAEIYPSLRKSLPVLSPKDRAEVVAMVEWRRDQDASGNLAGYFAAHGELDAAERKLVEREEGWILNLEPAKAPAIKVGAIRSIR